MGADAPDMKDMDFARPADDVSRDIIREALRMHKVMTGVTDDVNRANAQTGEEVFANWWIEPRLHRWRDVLNYQFLPLFGTTGQGVEFDYVFPMPRNREQDNAELTAKATAAQSLVTAGYDPHDVLEVVGLPDMDVVETATQAPRCRPGGCLTPPAAARRRRGAAPDEMAARLRKMLTNGHLPVTTGSR